MHAIVKPVKITTRHPDSRTRSGYRRNTVTWWKVFDENTGSEISKSHYSQVLAQKWADGFNAGYACCLADMVADALRE